LCRRHKRNCLLFSSQLPFRGFFIGSLTFSSDILTYRDLCLRFSLSLTTKGVSALSSIRWFGNSPGRTSPEDLLPSVKEHSIKCFKFYWFKSLTFCGLGQ